MEIKGWVRKPDGLFLWWTIGAGGNKSGEKKKRTAESVNFGLKFGVALIVALGLICFTWEWFFHGQ